VEGCLSDHGIRDQKPYLFQEFKIGGPNGDPNRATLTITGFGVAQKKSQRVVQNIGPKQWWNLIKHIEPTFPDLNPKTKI